eukprot:gene8035-1268_t
MPPRGAENASQAASQRTTQATPRTPDVEVEALHRMTFLQNLMANQVYTETDAKKLLASIVGRNDITAAHDTKCLNRLDLGNVTERASKSISLAFAGDMYRHTLADEPSKCGTSYTIPERDFFKATMERIAMAPYDGEEMGRIGQMELLNMDIRGSVTQPTQATQATQVRTFLELGDMLLHMDGLPEETKAKWQDLI